MKKRVCGILLCLAVCMALFATAATANPDADCPHENVGDNGMCTNCNHQFAIKREINVDGTRTTVWFDTVAEAVAGVAANTDTQLCLYADVSADSLTDGELILLIDLNGHTLTANVTVQKNFQLKSQISGGKLDGTVTQIGGVLILYGDTTVTGLVTLGGTANLLEGVTFEGGVKTTASGKTLMDYLSGAAFATNEAGGIAGESIVSGDTNELSGEVKTIAHTHTFTAENNYAKCACGFSCEHMADATTGQCDSCGYQFPVKRTLDVETAWFNTVDAALDNIRGTAAYTIVQLYLYEDVNAGAVSTSGLNLTLYLNGHTLTANVTVTDGGLLLTNGDVQTGGKLTGTVTNNNSGGSMFTTRGDVTISGLVTLASIDMLAVGTKLQNGVKTVASGGTLVDHLYNDAAFAGSDGSILSGDTNELSGKVNVIAHTHNYDATGKCACGHQCTNHDWSNSDGVCKNCGYNCPHTDYADAETCETCGATLKITEYNVWVCGVQVTSANKNDVLGDADEGATVVYTPATDTEFQTQKLTLKGAALEYAGNATHNAAIEAYDSLTVELYGSNTIKLNPRTTAAYTQYGIKVERPTTAEATDTADRTLTIEQHRAYTSSDSEDGLTITFADSEGKRNCAYGIYVGDANTTAAVKGNVLVKGDIDVDIIGGDATHISYGVYAPKGDVTVSKDNSAPRLSVVSGNVTSGTGNALSRGIAAGGKASLEGMVEITSGNATSTGGAAYSNGICAKDIDIILKATVESGTASGTTAANAGFYVDGGTLTVNISNDNYYMSGSIQTANNGKVVFTAGHILSVSTLDANTKLASYLAAGKAFASTGDSSIVNGYTTSLQNVKIVDHTSHSYDKTAADGKCACGCECPHANTSEDGNSCTDCGKQLYVAQIGNKKYATFNAAYEAAQDNDTITLLANAQHANFNKNITLTIDLNDKKLSSSDTSSHNIYIESGAYLLKNGTADNCNVYVRSGAALELGDNFKLEGTYYHLMDLSSNATLRVTGNNVEVATLNVLGYDHAVNCKLTRGTFGTINGDSTNPISSLLAEGYAFETTDGTKMWYDQYNNPDATTIYNVGVSRQWITGVTIESDKTSYTYGDTVKLTATVQRANNDTAGIYYEWYKDNDGTPFDKTQNDQAHPSENPNLCNYSSLDAGEHKIYVTVKTLDYTRTSEPITVTVNKATLTAGTNYTAPTAQSGLIYNGENQALLSAAGTCPAGTQFLYSLDYSNWQTDISNIKGKDAKDYTVYWELNGTNYEKVTGQTTVTIDPKQVTPVVTVAGGSTYDGTAQTPAVTVTLEGTALTAEDDYTVEYVNNVNAGTNTASVTVTATSNCNYTWEAVTQTFTIAKAAAPMLTAAETRIVYTQAPYTVDLSETIQGMPPDAGAVSYSLASNHLSYFSVNEATLIIDTSQNAGATFNAHVIVSSANYADATVTVTIQLAAKEQKALTVTMNGWTYGNTAKTPVYNKPDGASTPVVQYKSKGADDSTYSATAPTNAGEYTVKVSYETATEIWSGTADFTISPKGIGDVTIALNKDIFTYNGSDQKPTVTGVTDGSKPLAEDTDYTVSCDAQKNAGEGYTVTVTGKGNYTGTATRTWKITKETIYANASVAEKEYDGTTSATVTINFDTQAARDALISGDSIEVTGVTGTFDNKNVGTGKTVTLNSSNAVITGTNSENYDVIFPNAVLNGVIKAKPVTATVTVADKEYDGTRDATVTAEVKASDLIASDEIIISGLTGEFDNANVGNDKMVYINSDNRVISGSSSGNYEVEIVRTASGNITPAKATVTTAPAANTLTYTGGAQALVTAGEASGGEMQYRLGDTGEWTTTTPTGTTATDYTVWYKAKGDSNHSDTQPASIPVTIDRAALTVTANDKAITYGDAPADNGVTYSGFVGNETERVLTGTLGYEYSYSQYGNVGSSYAITPKGLTSSNYNITYVDGTLTVEPKEIGIVWANTSLTYNGKAQQPTATATRLVNGDSVIVTVTGGQTDAGEGYTATATTLSSGNYKLPENVTTSFTIGRAALTGVSAAQTGTLTYNGSAQTATVGTEAATVGGSAVSFTYSTTADGTYSADIPAFTTGTNTVYYKADAANHVTASGSFEVTIGKATVTIKALDKSAYTGTAAPDLSKPVADKDYTVTGLIGKDTLEVTIVLTCQANMNKVDKYDIVPSVTGEDSRYDFVFETGKLTVSDWPFIPSTGSTVKNPDGSTTTTTTDKATGTVTETTTTPNGTTSTTVIDKDGNVTESKVNVSEKDANTGGAVTIPVDGVEPVDSENAREITITVPDGGATVEIPVEDLTPGTVIVIVNPDGTETVVSGTKLTENGVQITLTENATIKVVDNT